MQIASFNVHGIGGDSIHPSVAGAMGELGVDNPELLAVGLQEVWRKHQLREVRRTFLGAHDARLRLGNVDVWHCPARAGWRCLVPRVASAPSLELASGLVLCVRGKLLDRFFQRYRGAGAFPDNLSNKGLLAALVLNGQRRFAVVNTHMHDSKNDAFGGARGHQIEQLANALKWIRKHWQGASTVLLGDFNVDVIEAIARTNPVTTTLYAKLLRAGRPAGPGWWDANARVHFPHPITTIPDGNAVLDLHLLEPEETRAAVTFATAHHASDHLLTKTRWT